MPVALPIPLQSLVDDPRTWPAMLGLALAVLAALALAAIGLRSRSPRGTRLAELSALSGVGQAILGAPLDLTGLAELIYRQVGQVVEAPLFQLGLFEADRYQLLAWVVDGQPRPPATFRLPADSGGIVAWVRESGQSLLVRDFETESQALPARPRYVADDPPRSAVFVPLAVGAAVLGVIVVQSRAPGAFAQRDLARLSIVANQAAAALQNARLLRQTQRRAAQLELLAQVSRQINAIQPLPSLYRQLVELIREKFDEYSVAFYECDADEAMLTLRATAGPQALDAAKSVALGDGPAGGAAQSRQPVVRWDLPEAPADAPVGVAASPIAELAVPVEIDDRVLGVLLIQSREGSDFDPTGLSVVQSLAEQMAMAILEARLYEAEQRRSEQLAAIAQATRAVTSTLDLDDLLDEVIDLVEERFGYERARIFLLEGGQLVYRAGLGGKSGRWAIEGLAYPLDGPGLIALAGRTGEPVLVPDVSSHPDYIPGEGLEDTRTEMAAPMRMGPHLLGVFDVQSERAGAFTDDDLRTLQTLSDTLAVAVRNARLFAAERRRRRLAESLREVSAALTSSLHLDDVLHRILDGLARVVNHDAASILLMNDLDELTLRAVRGAPQAEASLGLPLDIRLFPAGGPFPAAVPFAEVDHWGEYHQLLALPEPHACLGAALVLQGEHRGYLVVDRAGARPFSTEEMELITAFAAQASVAIENARLFTTQREEAWVSTALLQVAEATARAAELEDVLDTVARMTPMLVGVDRCGVLLADGDEFLLATYHGADRDGEVAGGISEGEESAQTLPHLQGGQGERTLEPGRLRFAVADWPALAEMVRSHEPVVVSQEQITPAELAELFSGVAILLPLLAKGQVEGALIVGQAPGEAPFSTRRIRLIGGIANAAAIAIESAKLYRSQQEEAWVSTALLQVAEAVAEQPTLDAGLETVARLTPMLVGIERVAILRWDEATEVFRPAHVVGLDLPSATEALSATASDLGMDLSPAGPSFHTTLPPALADAFGAAAVRVYPLWARGDLLGALMVEQVPLPDRRISILNGIAHQLAMAMESARLAKEVALQERLEREIEVARDIQASFLPDACPVLPGWEVCSLWRSARQVGGDFYDFIPLRSPDGMERWGVVIADVADKGVPAALFMALSKTLLRAAAINRTSPGETLARVNELILADARSDLFVTVFYAVWEPASGRVRYAVGGHNPPAWIRRDGAAGVLPGSGIALGVLDAVAYQEYEVRLEPGEVLVLFTDGLTDAVNAGMEEFGLERVLRVSAEARAGTASDILDALCGAVEAHAGNAEAFDDMTMVVVKRREA